MKTINYEIQVNQCEPNEDMGAEGHVFHMSLDELKPRHKYYTPFKQFIDCLDDKENWWYEMEISVWYLRDKLSEEWDREYLGIFYVDERAIEAGVFDKDFDKEYISNVPKYVSDIIEKWKQT